MNDVLLLLTLLTPAVLAVLWLLPWFRQAAAGLAVLVPLSPLAWALVSEGYVIDFPWMLLGARLGFDGPGRVLLGGTALLWLAVCVYSHFERARDRNRQQFDLFLFLTMTGNIGAGLAQDVASFFFFYTLMSMSAFGLIVHNRQGAARYAGAVYVMLTVLGEMALFAAAALAVSESRSLLFTDIAQTVAISPVGSAMAVLALLGFGVKLAFMPLHFWLPLAYAAAPVTTCAVLSGPMINGGLLGVLRILPFGIAAFESVGAVLIVLGIGSAFLGALFGLVQSNPKTVLGYSSISQMGLLTLGVGAGLLAPGAWKTVWAALVFFVFHHGVAKTALFLGIGVADATTGGRWRRYAVGAALAWAALSLAGLPLTTGLAAKTGLKYAAAGAPAFWAGLLETLLPWTSLATTLIMLRYLYLVWPQRDTVASAPPAAAVLPWAVLTILVTANWLACMALDLLKPSWVRLDLYSTWEALWPIAAAFIAAAFFVRGPAMLRRLGTIPIPPGDILIPLLAAVATCRRMLHAVHDAVIEWPTIRTIRNLQWPNLQPTTAVAALSRLIERDDIAGAFLILVGAILFLLLAL